MITNLTVIHGDSVEWVRDYQGPPFHAILGDAPYHLTSITKRFGKKNSAESKPDSDGGFNQRRSAGFMHQDWDGENFVAFKAGTWAAYSSVCYPGALSMMFGHARTSWQMTAGMAEAGMDILPVVYGWAYGSGMTTPTNPEKKLGEYWKGYRYGADMFKPALEPVVISQVPYPPGARRLDFIDDSGAGCLDIDAGRNERGNWPANFFIQHSFDCDPGACVDGCPAYGMDGKEVYYNQFYWFHECLEGIFNGQGVFYAPKPTRAEKEAGLSSLPIREKQRLNPGGMSADPKWAPVAGRNIHPTLKPISLTRQLAAMLLPPKSAVDGPRRILLPFAGVGSEAIGAMLAGWDEIVCVEITADYIPILSSRLDWWKQQIEAVGADESAILAEYKQSSRKTGNQKESGQLQLGLGV